METLVGELNNISTDILNYIAFYLCYIDLLSLINISWKHFKTIDRKYVKANYIIEKYMKRHGLKFENFAARTPKNSIVFGGFIFNVIFDNFDPLDIKSDIDVLHYDTCETDIVTTSDGKEESLHPRIYKVCSKITLNRGQENTFTYTNNNCDQMIKNPDGSGMFCYPLNLIKVDGSSSDKIIYQHLTLLHDTDSLPKYLDKHCDMDIAKCYCHNNKIYIRDLNKMFTRTDKISIINCYNKSLRFYNWWLKWSINEFYRLYDRICDRINKYRKRGINVEVDKELTSKEYLKELINIYGLNCDIKDNPYDPAPKIYTSDEQNILYMKKIVNKYDLFDVKISESVMTKLRRPYQDDYYSYDDSNFSDGD